MKWLKSIFGLMLLFILIFAFTSCGDEECEHEYVEKIVESTCTIDGSINMTCTKCEDSYLKETIPATGHVEVITRAGEPASCDKVGYTDEVSCSVCKLVLKSRQEIPSNYHKFGNWTEITAPTESTKGLLERVCEYNSNHKETYILNELNTKDYEYYVKAATCGQSGYRLYTAYIDGKKIGEYKVVIPKLDHDYKVSVIAPTCTEQGYDLHTCSNCGDSFKDNYTQALGHKINTTEIPSTCSEMGHTLYFCECGYSYKDNFQEKLLHTFKKEVTEPTCSTEGYTTYRCECGYSYVGDVKEKLPHNYVNKTHAPTCTSSGFVHHSCIMCGYSYFDEYVNPLGHSFDDLIVGIKPTETQIGYLYHQCLLCSDRENVYIPILNDVDYEVSVTEPTCIEQGSKIYTYEIQNKTFTFVTNIEKIAHTPISYIDMGDNHKVICKYGCEYLENHTHTDFEVTKTPTCSEEGIKTRTCTICNKVIEVPLEKTEHTIEEILAKEPTCSEVGNESGTKCSVCNEYIIFPTEIEKKPHTYVNGICSVCNEVSSLTVTYMNGDEIYETKTYLYGDTFSELELEDLNLKYFIGWTNIDGTVSYTIDTLIKEDLIVYAKWDESIAVTNKEELLAIEINKSYHLTNNIDLGGANWKPLSAYNGIFDGNNYTIVNFNLTTNTDTPAANYSMFGVNNGVIKNFRIKDMVYSVTGSNVGTNTMAVLAAENKGIIENIHISNSIVTVNTYHYTLGPDYQRFGFLIGINYGKLLNSSVNNNLSYYSYIKYANQEQTAKCLYYVGGLVSINEKGSLIENSSYEGTLSINQKIEANRYAARYYYAESTLLLGGVAALNTSDAVINKTYAKGELVTICNDISSTDYTFSSQFSRIGGLVGQNTGNAVINECFSSTVITNGTIDESHIGGLVGQNAGNANISSCHTESTISFTNGVHNSHSNKTVSSIGGLVGNNASNIQNSYSIGAISTLCKATIGGFVGVSSSGQINKCFTKTHVNAHSGTSDKFIASGIGTIAKCYYLSSLEHVSGSSTTGTININADINQIDMYQLLDVNFLNNILYWDLEGWYIGSDDFPFLKWEFDNLHNFELVVEVKPTCILEGYNVYKCSECNKVVFTDLSAALGHVPMDDGDVVIEPTHTEVGKMEFTCSRDGCGVNVLDIEPLGHDNIDTINCNDSNLKFEDGIYYYLCSCSTNNNEVYIKINANNVIHNNIEQITAKEPTCGVYDDSSETWSGTPEKGHTAGIGCLDCGQILQGKVDILPHAYDEDSTTIIIEATCSSLGLVEKECYICHSVEQYEIPKLAHTYQNGSIKCSTCNEERYSIDSSYIAINSASELLNINMYGNYYLAKDINLADLSNNGIDFVPIGTANNPFKGVLLGNGYKILNLNLVYESKESLVAGLFAYNSGIIAGLTIENANIISSNVDDATLAIIAAVNTGTIYRCEIKGEVIINLAISAKCSEVIAGSKSFNFSYGGIAALNGSPTNPSGNIDSCSITANISYRYSIISEFAPTSASEKLNELFKTGKMTVYTNIISGGICAINRGKVLNTSFNPSTFNYSNSSTANTDLIAKVGGINRGKAYIELNLTDGAFIGYNTGEVLNCNSIVKNNNYHLKDSIYNVYKEDKFIVVLKYEEVKVLDKTANLLEYKGYFGELSTSSKITEFNN